MEGEDRQDLMEGWERQQKDQHGSGTHLCPGVAKPSF